MHTTADTTEGLMHLTYYQAGRYFSQYGYQSITKAGRGMYVISLYCWSEKSVNTVKVSSFSYKMEN